MSRNPLALLCISSMNFVRKCRLVVYGICNIRYVGSRSCSDSDAQRACIGTYMHRRVGV
jgi:hypothetical protein